jgi:hypothetical protein
MIACSSSLSSSLIVTAGSRCRALGYIPNDPAKDKHYIKNERIVGVNFGVYLQAAIVSLVLVSCVPAERIPASRSRAN